MRKITFLPIDPGFRLTPELEEAVNDRISEVFEDPGDVECHVFTRPIFTCAEADLDETTPCPACGDPVDLHTIAGLDVRETSGGFATALPCCGVESGLERLNGSGPWGFSCLSIVVCDAGNENVTPETAVTIGAALGTPVVAIDETVED